MRRASQRLVHDSDGRTLCPECAIADNPWRRMRGLLGRSDLPAGEGLLIKPAPAIHTFFMRFPIDVVFVDRQMRIVAVRDAVKPWRAAGRRGAHAALELAAGEVARRGFAVGDQLVVTDTPDVREADRAAA